MSGLKVCFAIADLTLDWHLWRLESSPSLWEKGTTGSRRQHTHPLTPILRAVSLGNCAGSEKWVQS